jgi:dTDP-4-amino-4,6-dideoxygalactose transaminase
LPFMAAYEYLGYSKSDFPVVYNNQSKILSLPIFPELTIDQQTYIADSIKEFFL